MISNQLFIEFKSELLKIKDKKKLERSYYEKLSKCLKAGQFKAFEMLINVSVDFDIFIDVFKIPNRFNIISKLLLNCTEKISSGYQTSALGEIIDILRFCNKYRLLEKKINYSEQTIVNSFKEKNRLFLANLYDLFGKVSDSFVLYVYKIMPQDLYEFFVSSSISYFPDRDGLMDYIKNSFFDQYTIYGLSVRNLIPEDSNQREKICPMDKFFRDLHEILKENQAINKELVEIKIFYKYQIFFYNTEENEQLVEKKHLVSPKNILKNKGKILDKNNYNFYSLSMVLLGGLGPQGLGFTYSTPRGEIIEICSDQKETEAIIIKYKQYLKGKFLKKLEKELENFGIKEKVKNEIINFLSDILNQKELINYYKKEPILKKVKKFLQQIDEFQQDLKPELQELINKISNAISIILRRIKLKDQFITRMNLVAEDKIKSEDIAKLTSLKGKTHYDVLRERYFFQYIIDWFYNIYSTEKLKIQNKNID